MCGRPLCLRRSDNRAMHIQRRRADVLVKCYWSSRRGGGGGSRQEAAPDGTSCGGGRSTWETEVPILSCARPPSRHSTGEQRSDSGRGAADTRDETPPPICL
ncbi:hypothetical protein NQZ68_007930 [Dissostichus eleginoides]|nr:hypothetical protein NQZ68_007930 [Dissostichus eleginoides]